eukprot:SAG31_NODE_2161_length_6297_cov_1.823169_3_plen_71_part_00
METHSPAIAANHIHELVLLGDVSKEFVLELVRGKIKPNFPLDTQTNLPLLCLQPGVARVGCELTELAAPR